MKEYDGYVAVNLGNTNSTIVQLRHHDPGHARDVKVLNVEQKLDPARSPPRSGSRRFETAASGGYHLDDGRRRMARGQRRDRDDQRLPRAGGKAQSSPIPTRTPATASGWRGSSTPSARLSRPNCSSPSYSGPFTRRSFTSPAGSRSLTRRRSCPARSSSSARRLSRAGAVPSAQSRGSMTRSLRS